jgi:hypothetical protein
MQVKILCVYEVKSDPFQPKTIGVESRQKRKQNQN